ncbi:conserved hypothetical protein [Alteracholeplasma palmae J233]|uniref:AprE-like beta-barrel domain-containing protein n=1 Tax=Alteracholeplasma palmae (strain ATCC 49389 / J233) TaxID=1318466 RepID=U4KJK2_ALTPJ|nr:conserved hypothetical protein [Alteracholeplasma palmae J233]
MIQYNKKVPNFLFWILTVIVTLVTFILILAHFTYKEEVIRSTGMISTTGKTHIMSLTGGEIKEVHKPNGSYVEKGEVILSLNTISVDVQIKALNEKLEYMTKEVDGFDSFIKALENFDLEDIDKNKNPFEKGELYLTYETFLESIRNSTEDKPQEELKKERQTMINQYLSQYYSQKKQYQYELVGLKGQKEAYELSLTTYQIVAQEKGYINYQVNLTKGMVVGNDSLGTISERVENANSRVEGYISAQYRSFIKEEDLVEMVIAGLPQSDYGMIRGTIESISTDSIVNEDQVLYKIIVKPEKLELSKRNSKVALTSGQVSEMRIKYHKTTWLNWGLEKLGIINK